MIEIHSLSMNLGNFSLKNINLYVEKGEYFVLIGPTGAGKTTLLECIAGLKMKYTGKITINGRDVSKLPPEKRKIGYVPQECLLFPFLNVFENIAFGLKKGKTPRTEVSKRVKNIAEIIGIKHLLPRQISSLSGGEKQRVSLARAVVVQPEVLLLDEPLGSIDLKTAKLLRLQLKNIQKKMGITTIHVTHNQIEAEELADRIGVIFQGKIEQIGKAEEIFFCPSNENVSELIGSPNILECSSSKPIGAGLMEVQCGSIKILIPHEVNEVKKISISPTDVYISDIKPPGPEVNRYRAKVEHIDKTNTMVRIKLKIDNICLHSEIEQETFETMNIKKGREVFIILKLRRIKPGK